MSVIARVDERLTPDRVQSVSFPPDRLGRRGLDEDHVRAFCAHVERELVTRHGRDAAGPAAQEVTDGPGVTASVPDRTVRSAAGALAHGGGPFRQFGPPGAMVRRAACFAICRAISAASK